MSFDGDISRLELLVVQIENLSQVADRAADAVAPVIRALIEEEFAEQSDPYGHAWKPHAPATIARWGAHDILDLSGNMRKSLDVQATSGTTVSVHLDAPAGVHQSTRPMVPIGGVVPESWHAAIQKAVDDEIRRVTS